MYYYETILGTLILIFSIIYINIMYDGIIWKYADDIITWIDDYYNNAINSNCVSFPNTEIPLVFPTISSNGCSSSSICRNYPCMKNCCNTNNCDQREIIYGCYKYVVDKLPGLINKYKVNECNQTIDLTNEIITHNLGILRRIYIKCGKIIVEDSFSIEHTANVNPITGYITF